MLSESRKIVSSSSKPGKTESSSGCVMYIATIRSRMESVMLSVSRTSSRTGGRGIIMSARIMMTTPARRTSPCAEILRRTGVLGMTDAMVGITADD